jgi:hypothetical protein
MEVSEGSYEGPVYIPILEACGEKPMDQRLDRTRSGSNTDLLVPAGNERIGIKSRTDFFRGHQPPS